MRMPPFAPRPRGNFEPALLPPFGHPCPLIEAPGILQDKIRQVQETSQAPLPLVILAGLATSAFLVQGLINIRKPNGQKIPASLFCITIAESGEGKTSVLKSFIDPIDSFLTNRTAQNQAKWEKYERDMEVWKATRKQLIRSISKAAIKENKIINDAELSCQLHEHLEQHDKRKPTSPESSDITMMSDATPAAIANYLNRQQVKSLGILTSEGDEFFSRGIKQDSALFNNAWSGDATRRYRAVKGDQSFQSDISIGAAIQPLAAQAIFDDRKKKLRGSGFLARTLFTFPISNQGFRDPNRIIVNNSQDKDYRRRVQQLLALNTKYLHDKSLSKVVLSFTPEAQEKWFRLQWEIENEIRPNGRYFSFQDHASKLSDNIARVASILHVMEHGLEKNIALESLYQAIDICMYCSDEFLRFFHEPPQEEVDAVKLSDWLCKKRQAGYRYICKSFVLTHGPLKPVARLDIALNILFSHQIIGGCNYPRQTATGRPTKPKVIIDLYPNLPTDNVTIQQVAYGY